MHSAEGKCQRQRRSIASLGASARWRSYWSRCSWLVLALREVKYGLLTPKNGDARALHMTIHTSRARLGTTEKVHAPHPRRLLGIMHEQVDVNGACQSHSTQHPSAQSRARTSATVARAVVFTRRCCAHTCLMILGRCERSARDEHGRCHHGAHMCSVSRHTSSATLMEDIACCK